jgi:hypothetical protein
LATLRDRSIFSSMDYQAFALASSVFIPATMLQAADIAQIARELHLDLETVAKWVRANYTIARTNASRKSKLDPYKVIIRR